MLVNQLSRTAAPSQTVALDYDIAIVGGGIVGATLACALKDSGLKIAIIETQIPAAAAAKKQAYAVTLLSGMILESIGVWEQILPQITTFEQISLCDGDYPGVVEFHRPDLGNTGNPALRSPLKRKNRTTISPLSAFGRAARWEFYHYQETVVK